jgi:uncharacterized LabA/DUF88 family protein
MPDRVMTYIDGFNLYYGLKEASFNRYYWLDMTKLSSQLLQAGQVLIETKYFTARINGPAGCPRRKRQTTFLDALSTLPGLRIFEGHYLGKPANCNSCGATWTIHEEKMTDVCIATELLMDAHADKFDTAIVISGDSDLVPPVNAIHSFFAAKRVIVAFPPKRHSVNLKNAAKASFQIGRAKIAASQMPDIVVKPNGFNLVRPLEWNPPLPVAPAVVAATP